MEELNEIEEVLRSAGHVSFIGSSQRTGSSYWKVSTDGREVVVRIADHDQPVPIANGTAWHVSAYSAEDALNGIRTYIEALRRAEAEAEARREEYANLPDRDDLPVLPHGWKWYEKSGLFGLIHQSGRKTRAWQRRQLSAAMAEAGVDNKAQALAEILSQPVADGPALPEGWTWREVPRHLNPKDAPAKRRFYVATDGRRVTSYAKADTLRQVAKQAWAMK